jgi:predicted nuclease of predicted toxin-antitoxin system
MEPGISDDEVLALANHEGAILITADKDFGELVFRLRYIATGIILVRLAGLSISTKSDIIAMTIREHETELFSAFVVVSPISIRIQKLG